MISLKSIWGALALLSAIALVSGAEATAVTSSSRSDAVAMESGADRFKQYVQQQIAGCITEVGNMRDRIAAKDLGGAQRAWIAARAGWESSEVITNEYLPDLDRRIDAWPDADQGFHAIEARLFGAHDVAVQAAADELLNNLREFDRQLREIKLSAQGLLNGSAKLAFEIGEDKAGGGESPFSGNSLPEMRDNLAAIRAAYDRVFAATIKKRNSDLSKTFLEEHEAIKQLLSVRQLRDLDQLQLRRRSESLTNDLALMAQASGLTTPRLGN